MIKSNVFQTECPWGNFRQFTQDASSTVKILTVLPNEELSLQSHKKRSEFWYIISGSGTVIIGESEKPAVAGDEYKIAPEEKHRLTAGPEGIKVLEISTGDFDEEDIIRFEDKYSRA